VKKIGAIETGMLEKVRKGDAKEAAGLHSKGKGAKIRKCP
jgi:hypothetical protein